MNIEQLAREAASGFGNSDDLMADSICGIEAITRFAALVRNAALEEAAVTCDTKREIRAVDGFPREASTARALANEIRSMKEKT